MVDLCLRQAEECIWLSMDIAILDKMKKKLTQKIRIRISKGILWLVSFYTFLQSNRYEKLTSEGMFLSFLEIHRLA